MFAPCLRLQELVTVRWMSAAFDCIIVHCCKEIALSEWQAFVITTNWSTWCSIARKSQLVVQLLSIPCGSVTVCSVWIYAPGSNVQKCNSLTHPVLLVRSDAHIFKFHVPAQIPPKSEVYDTQSSIQVKNMKRNNSSSSSVRSPMMICSQSSESSKKFLKCCHRHEIIVIIY